MVYVGVGSAVGTLAASRYLSIYGGCRGWLSSRNCGGVYISKYFMVYVGVGSAVGTAEVSRYLRFYGV